MPKILLVDDEAIERQVLKQFVEEAYPEISRIDEACNGKMAIQIFEQVRHDIVIMDIKMPGIDGYEASKVLKIKKPDTVIIFLTAFFEPEKMYQAYKSGGQEYLQKPVRKTDFLNVLIKYLPKKDDSLLLLKNSLYDSIIKNNLVASKRILTATMDNINQRHPEGSVVAIKADYMALAQGLMDTVFDINKKFMTSKPTLQKKLDTMGQISESYPLKCWMEDYLESILDILASEKSDTLQYDETTKVLNYIEKNFRNRITLEEVAEHVNMSPYYLSKQFKKQIGINFIDYVTDLKIKCAKEMLVNTNKPVIDISIELSFNEPNYFTRVFRKVTGMTPIKFREISRLENAHLKTTRGD